MTNQTKCLFKVRQKVNTDRILIIYLFIPFQFSYRTGRVNVMFNIHATIQQKTLN